MLLAHSLSISAESIQPFFPRGTLALFKLAHLPLCRVDFLVILNVKILPCCRYRQFQQINLRNSSCFFADNGI